MQINIIVFTEELVAFVSSKSVERQLTYVELVGVLELVKSEVVKASNGAFDTVKELNLDATFSPN